MRAKRSKWLRVKKTSGRRGECPTGKEEKATGAKKIVHSAHADSRQKRAQEENDVTSESWVEPSQCRLIRNKQLITSPHFALSVKRKNDEGFPSGMPRESVYTGL